MSALFPPPQNRTIGYANVNGQRVPVQVESAWFQYFAQGLYDRSGGALGASTTDLERSAFEDAGIEETKAALYAFADEMRRAPVAEPMQAKDMLEPGIEELRGRVEELARAIEELKQGLIP